MEGLFISFEGMDGCGKSTQIRFLAEELRKRGYDVLTTREPGGCRVSEQIRDILLDVENAEMSDKTEALLYAAARAQHVNEVIKPALNAGKVVLTDRFLDSSLAYQGAGRDLSVEKISEIGRFSTGGLMPYKTFFLDFPPEKAFKRMNEHKKRDRLETQQREFYINVYKCFKQLAESEPERFIIIDVSGNKFQTHAKILEKTNEILGETAIKKVCSFE